MYREQIIIVEDDPEIRECTRILLESENYLVKEAESGIEALKILDDETDLIILDIMMPGISGIRTCEEIRKESNVPILFLTARSQESDKLIGLMAGGDDYLTKPFSYAELLGRAKALLRRYNKYKGRKYDVTDEGALFIERGGIRINENSQEVYKKGKFVDLTSFEYKILLLMMKNPKKVFSAANLYESVWNEPFFYTNSNTVMVHIRNLRTKIETDPKEPRLIKTIWGRGYRFDV